MNACHTKQSIAAWLVAGFLLAGAQSALADNEPAKNPREQLDTLIPEAIRLLEAKEYQIVLKMIVPPDVLKQITEGSSLEKFAETFGRDHAADLLTALKAIKEVKPTLDAKGETATYELKPPIDGKDSITLVKIEKYWYIADK